jgi:hypothetical protein
VALGLGALAPPAAAQSAPASCDVPAQNLYVRDVMADIYFWYQHIPDVDPVAFESPAHYLEAGRVNEFETT